MWGIVNLNHTVPNIDKFFTVLKKVLEDPKQLSRRRLATQELMLRPDLERCMYDLLLRDLHTLGCCLLIRVGMIFVQDLSVMEMRSMLPTESANLCRSPSSA